MTARRNHNVQTPGEAPQATPTEQPEGGAPVATDTSAQAPAAITAPAEPMAAEPAAKPKATKAPKTRAEYATTPAADIDPAAITAPVLSRDGWVIPAPKD